MPSSPPPSPKPTRLDGSRLKGQTEQLPAATPRSVATDPTVTSFEPRGADAPSAPLNSADDPRVTPVQMDSMVDGNAFTVANAQSAIKGAPGAAGESNYPASASSEWLSPDSMDGLSSMRPVGIGDTAGAYEAQRSSRNMAGTVLGERYQLMNAMARGGMGEVFVARHLALDTLVAVKVMLEEVASEEGYVKRFHREARAMSLLNHRNIVRVLDYGAQDGVPYIVMELLNGRPVSEWLYQLDELPPLSDVDDIMRQLLDGFEAAHRAGIVHRDLKPDNIFLSMESDGQRVVKLLDFGLARIDGPAAQGTTVTTVQTVSGTPEYMSPEQCRSLSVTALADFYAMGCVLTEMLQGFPPFDGPSHADIMTKQMFVAPPSLQRPNNAEEIPPLLERLRLDLLAKNESRRPQTIAELRDRWNEAMDRERSAQRLPARKAQPPMGTRSHRRQDWTNPAAPMVLHEPEEQQTVGLLRMFEGEDGLTESCALGLAAGGLGVRPFHLEQDLTEVDVVVIDAGARIDEACDWLSARWPLMKQNLLAFPVVCVHHVDARILNRLIAAGAGDVVVYPVDIVVLARKLRRALRKATRQRSRSQ